MRLDKDFICQLLVMICYSCLLILLIMSVNLWLWNLWLEATPMKIIFILSTCAYGKELDGEAKSNICWCVCLLVLHCCISLILVYRLKFSPSQLSRKCWSLAFLLLCCNNKKARNYATIALIYVNKLCALYMMICKSHIYQAMWEWPQEPLG